MPLEVADAEAVAEPIAGASVRVVNGPVPPVLVAELFWLFNGDITRSMTCIKPLLVLVWSALLPVDQLDIKLT